MLGESAFWSAEQKSLYWLDIIEKRLYVSDTHLKFNYFKLPIICSVILLVSEQKVVLASEHGIAEYEFSTGGFTVVISIEKNLPGMRSNDGSVDSCGRYWVGTMQKHVSSSAGSIYCVEPKGSVTKVLGDIGIPNTMLWLSDTELLIADSFIQIIYLCKVDPCSSEILSKSIWLDLSGQKAVPDGSCLDSNGNVWNAQWDGFRVVKYSSKGEELMSIKLPVPRPTSCAITDDGSRLFVTSAKEGLSLKDLDKFPLSGSTFEIEL